MIEYDKTEYIYYIGTSTISYATVTQQCVIEDLNLLVASLFMSYRKNISTICSSNSEASASELLEHIVEMFPVYL